MRQGQTDDVDAQCLHLVQILLDGTAAGCPEDVADVLLHRGSTWIGSVRNGLVASLQPEPGSAADRVDDAILRDSALRIHTENCWSGCLGGNQARRISN